MLTWTLIITKKMINKVNLANPQPFLFRTGCIGRIVLNLANKIIALPLHFANGDNYTMQM